MFTGFCSYNKEQKTFKNEQKEKWDGDRRKYLIKKLPEDLAQYPHMEMEQAYLCTEPVVRVRKEGEDYVLTYKSKGLMVREEYNLPLTKESYEHLLEKRMER